MKTKNLFTAIAIIGLFATTSCKTSKTEEIKQENTAPVSEVVKTNQIPNIVGVAVGNENFSTLVAAVKAADLVETLSGNGPFTVFAPTNSAFAKLPEGTIATLLKPENKATLTSILTYHVVAGKMSSKDIMKAIKMGNGKATLKTVSGGTLTAWMKGKKLYITDEKGGMSMITIANVNQSNGVIHVVDTVVLPKA